MTVSFELECLAKAVVVILTLAVFYAPSEFVRRHRRPLLLGLAALGALAHPSHSLTSRDLPHLHEQFHYVLGAKYFRELGYDGLYEAAYASLLDSNPRMAPRSIRDLRTNRVVGVQTIRARARARLDAMSPSRRAEFESDVALLVMTMGRFPSVKAFLDHGYNAPPTFTVVARALLPDGPLEDADLRMLASLDFLLMVSIVLGIGLVFGPTAAALAVLVATTAYTWNYDWTGGGYLRWDWIAAVSLAVAALARRRLVLAGALLAYATSVRVFPAVFAFAALLPYALELRRPTPRAEASRLLGSYLIALVLLSGLGCANGRGLSAYSDFRDRIAVHRTTWLTNDVGLGTMLVADLALVTDRHRDDRSAAPHDAWAGVVGAARRTRAPFALAVTAVIAVFLARRLRGRSPHVGAAFGTVLLFTASSPANYYWVVCLLVPLVAPRRVVAMLLASTLVLVAFAPHGMVGGIRQTLVASACLSVVFAAWLASLRAEPPEPAAADDLETAIC